MFSCKDLYLRDILYSYCVRRQSSKDLLPNTSALHDVVHFILFYSSDFNQKQKQSVTMIRHPSYDISTKVTSGCISMYKLLLCPRAWCDLSKQMQHWNWGLFQFTTLSSAAYSLRSFQELRDPLIGWRIFFVKQNILSTNFPNKPQYDFCFLIL